MAPPSTEADNASTPMPAPTRSRRDVNGAITRDLFDSVADFRPPGQCSFNLIPNELWSTLTGDRSAEGDGRYAASSVFCQVRPQHTPAPKSR